MRETKFIEQNKKKWSEFEGLLKDKSDDPDKLSELYIQITDDLSYSRTYYPNRSVRVYLNGLAQGLFYKIYKNKKSRLRGFLKFWTHELPEIVHRHRSEMRLSMFVFFLAMGIGVLSCFMDETFPYHIMGESYMNMTEENIATGDPMAVYKQQGEFDMFMGITLNNLWVAFFTFITGLFFAVGSIAIMIKNGVMVGTFQYYFYDQGLFVESFLTIWVHGTLEISAIIIAGAAGIVMGKGLVFPGTYSRMHSFRVSARRGLKILLGIVPIIIMAGFIEGFLTRYTDAPDLFRLAFIMASLFFILGYFVYYPWMMARNGKFKKEDGLKLPTDNIQETDYRRIKRNGEIFLDSFTFFKRNMSRIFGFAAVISVIYTVGAYIEYKVLGGVATAEVDVLEEIWFMFESDAMVHMNSVPLEVLSVLLMSLFAVWVSYFLVHESKGRDWRTPLNKGKFRSFFFRNILKAIIVVALINCFFMLPLWLTVVGSLFALPFLFMWMYIAQREKKPFFGALGRAFNLANNAWGKILGLSGILVMIGGMLNVAIRSPLLGLYNYFISENLFANYETVDQFTVVVGSFIGYFALSVTLALMLAGFSFLYFSLREIQEAESLFRRIPRIGDRNQAFGMEKESRYVEVEV